MAIRRDLFDPTDLASFQPEQRLTEVAAILAAGVIHMREQRAAKMPKVWPRRKGVRNTGLPSNVDPGRLRQRAKCTDAPAIRTRSVTS